jgi:hypothetical protein
MMEDNPVANVEPNQPVKKVVGEVRANCMHLIITDTYLTSGSFIQNGEAVWARMAGFPSWPARRCSKHEEDTMTIPRAAKLKQAAVVFLGNRGEMYVTNHYASYQCTEFIII